jgi:hypothetical protein
VTDLAFAPDNTTCAFAVQDRKDVHHKLVVWNTATGTTRRIWSLGTWWIQALRFSPEGRVLYSCSIDNKVCVWDMASGEKLREFAAGNEARITQATFSPDGKWLACAGQEPVALLVETVTGKVVHRLAFPFIPYRTGFAFSADSRTVAMGFENGEIELVESASGKVRKRLVGGHQAVVATLLFSSDGQRLISGSADTTALIWDLNARLEAPVKPLDSADLDACWNDLASQDAEAAYRSIRRLAASPAEVVPYLDKRLQPVARADKRHLSQLIADLDSDHFAVRDRAFKELEAISEGAADACRAALARGPSPELRRRLEALLQKQDEQRWSPSPQRLCILRALEALEDANTPAARQLMQRMATGAPESAVTQEAKATVGRMTARSDQPR